MRDYLKELREKKGLTMAEIAKKLDVSESYYCMIEKGQRQERMDITLAAKLSVILGISLSEIVAHEHARAS
jgi:transcriptional regulator with XRE-family HTH domain